jgi:hypothetical protein
MQQNLMALKDIFVKLSETKSASSVNNQKGAFLKVFHDHRRPFVDVFLGLRKGRFFMIIDALM